MKDRTTFDLKSLKHYMFTKNHIMDLCIDQKLKKMKAPKTNNTQKQKVKITDKDNIFIPIEKDKLFWCYYVLVNGLGNYQLLDNKRFKEEKEQKINLVEKLRAHKDLLKKNKWKRNAIEHDLVYNPVISIDTFMCICAISNINIAIVQKRCLYTLKDIEGLIKIVEMTDIGFGCYLLENEEIKKKYNDYCATFWRVENIQKPLAAISSYKIASLHDICNRLNLPLKTVDGKKLKKKDLYESIKSNI